MAAGKPDEGSLWRLTFRVLPHELPEGVRVRWLLKYALRALGLRCVRVDEPAKEGEGVAGPSSAKPAS